MEGVFLQEIGDVSLEGPRDVGSNKRIASAEVEAYAEQLLNTREGGVCPSMAMICRRDFTANKRR